MSERAVSHLPNAASWRNPHRAAVAARFAIVTLYLAFAVEPTHAQDESPSAPSPNSLFHEFSLETIGTSDRLPHAVARCLAQGADGRLWIGTLGGLASFDGRTIRIHELPPDEIPRQKWIISAFAASDGTLWFGGDRRILRYDGSFRSFGPADGLPEALCESIAQDSRGVLYFGMGPHLLSRTGDRFTEIPLESTTDPSTAGGFKVRADRAGNVFVRNDEIVGRLESQGLREIEVSSAEKPALGGFVASPHGGFWISDGTSISLVRDERIERRLEIPKEFRSAAVALLEDSAGNLWVGSFYHGIVVFLADGRTLTAKLRDGLPHTHITSLCETATGEIFAGSGGAGLFQFRRRLVRNHVRSDRDSTENSIVAVQTVGNGRVIATSVAGTVSLVDRDGVTPVLSERGFLDVRAAILRRSGDLVIAVPESGLLVGRAGTWSDLASSLRYPTQVFCLVEDSQGDLWVGSDRGLLRERGGAFIDLPLGLNSAASVLGIVEDDRGSKIVATDRGVVRVDADDRVTQLADSREGPHPAAVGICKRSDGSIVVSDEGGYILQVDGNALVSVFDGPVTPNTPLGPMIEDDYSRIWSVTDAGLLCIEWQGGVLQRRRIGRSGGLYTSALRVFGQPRLAKTEDGRIWIAANQHGLLSIDPKTLGPREIEPRLILEAIVSDPKHPPQQAKDGSYSLATSTDLVRLQIAAPDFAEPRLRRYEYRLRDDEDWVDVGDSQQILLHHIPPGDYAVEVRTFAARCGWPDAQLVVRLTLSPHFWQRGGFLLGCALTLLALLTFAIRNYERRKSRALLAKLDQQRSIAHERARFESLFDATSNLVGFLSRTGEVLRLNPSARSALIDLDTVPQRTFDALFPESERRLIVDTILPTVGARGSWQGRIHMLGNDRKEFPAQLLIHAHRTTEGGIEYMSWIAHDMSERVRAAEQRRSLEQQLQRAQKAEALGTLAGGIAHDFNNVLTAILGYAELSRDNIDQPADVELGLSRIVAAAQHARALVARIMTFGRARPNTLRPIEIESVARDATELVRAALQPNVVLRCDIQECPSVLIDETELQQVLVNLLTNASHAIGDANGTIHLTVEPATITSPLRCVHRDLDPGRYVRVRVSDDGCGIPSELQERIFDLFFTTKPQGRGTGLGLAIVLGSVSNTGGGILVESREGRGTTFTLLFPAFVRAAGPLTTKAPASDRTARSEAKPALAESALSILVVDDDELAREALVNLLTRLGHRVAVHSMPTDAWNAFRARPDQIDVVVTDLRMPEMSGIDLAKRILSIRPGMPIVVVTGYGDTGQLDSIANERVGFLRKPFTLDELSTCIANVLPRGSLST